MSSYTAALNHTSCTPNLPSLIATPNFLDSLITLFPANSSFLNPWFYIASIIFIANDRPADALAVFDYVVAKFPVARHLEFARVYKEALFKTNVLYGATRFINLQAQWASKHPQLIETQPYRDYSLTIPQLTQLGRNYFADLYGSSLNTTLTTLDKTHPDFLYYVLGLVYGPIFAYEKVVGRVETSFSFIAALVGIGSAPQASLHLEGALRRGAKREEVKAVRDICTKVLKALGKRVDNIPDLPQNVPKRVAEKRWWVEDGVDGVKSRL